MISYTEDCLINARMIHFDKTDVVRRHAQSTWKDSITIANFYSQLKYLSIGELLIIHDKLEQILGLDKDFDAVRIPFSYFVKKDEVEKKLLDILIDHFGNANITSATKFIDDLGADSLDTIELLMIIEDEFDIQIDDEDAEKINTVGEAVKLIKHCRANPSIQIFPFT